MFAYRSKWTIKEGRVQEAVELLKGPVAGFKEEGLEARVYFDPQESSRPVVIWEENWEDPEAREKFWSGDVNESDAAKAFWPKWHDVVDGESKDEVWSLLKQASGHN